MQLGASHLLSKLLQCIIYQTDASWQLWDGDSGLTKTEALYCQYQSRTGAPVSIIWMESNGNDTKVVDVVVATQPAKQPCVDIWTRFKGALQPGYKTAISSPRPRCCNSVFFVPACNEGKKLWGGHRGGDLALGLSVLSTQRSRLTGLWLPIWSEPLDRCLAQGHRDATVTQQWHTEWEWDQAEFRVPTPRRSEVFFPLGTSRSFLRAATASEESSLVEFRNCREQKRQDWVKDIKTGWKTPTFKK